MLRMLCVFVWIIATTITISGCGDSKKEEVRIDVCKQIFSRIVEISRECGDMDSRMYGHLPYSYFGYGYCLYDGCCFVKRGGRQFIELNREYKCAE